MVKKKERQVILASGSPRRKNFFKQLGINHKVIKSRFDEDMSKLPKNMSAEDVAMHFAEEKAREVATRKSGLIVGSDTIVVKGKKILGKPKNKKDALMTLKSLTGTQHQVISGVAIIDTVNGEVAVCSETTQIFMRKASEAELKRYVATGEPLDKAGSYGIQGKGGIFIEHIEGCYSNVIGLPLPLLIEMLELFGVKV